MIHSRARAWYRLLLHAYPADFRARYGDEMEDGFERILSQELKLSGRVRWGRVWAMACWDVMANGVSERWGVGSSRVSGKLGLRTKWGGDVMGSIASDIHYALRALRRKPAFTVTAVVTLGLGIGANTAIFSIVNGLLIRDLPYEESDRLVHIWSQNHQRGWSRTDIPLVDAWDFRTRTSAFEDVAAYDRQTFTLTGTDRPERLSGHGVTYNVFSVLGVAPAHGRDFTETDGRLDVSAAAILSYGFWERRFGSDPDVIGSTVHLDGEPTTVVGVMPKQFPFIDSRPDLWVPFRIDPAAAPRGDHSHVAVGRLASGVDRDRANREVAQVALSLQTEHPESNTGWTTNVTSVQRDQLGDTGVQAALIMMVAVGVVLLMACTNVANLLLARADGRRLEMAIRSAMGAGRGRMLRQALTESLVLAAIGGVLGAVLALWGTGAIARSMPSNLSPIYTFEMDSTVLGFAALASLGAAVLFGLAPALRASRLQGSELRDGGRSGPGTRGKKFGGFLVVAQTALAVVLLIGGGIMGRSVMGMAALDLGYEAEGLIAFRVSPPEDRFEDQQAVTAFYHELLDGVRSAPGVDGAGAVLVLPLSGSNRVGSFALEGTDPEDPATRFSARFNTVSPGYFETMGVELRQGRAFSRADGVESPRVVIVNETLADRYFSPGGALGHRLLLGGEEWEIVGIVQDHFERNLADPIRPGIYYPASRSTTRSRAVVVRSAGDPAALVPSLRNLVLDIDNDLPIYGVTPMVDLVERSVGAYALMARLMAGFALISLVLGAVGIYGVMAYGVGQRTNEIGIRMALGAGRQQVRAMVVRNGMWRGVVGVLIGLSLAVPAMGAMSGLLVDVTPTDPAIFGGVTVLLLSVAFLGSWLPALRAAAVEPTQALSQE